MISTQVAAHPDTTLGVALACRDASLEASAVLIVVLAADEDLNRFWPVLSQWEAWVKSNEMGLACGHKFNEACMACMRELADAASSLFV